MTVNITSPVLGKNVGETYTGSLESWLLANGYASQAAYTGPGVANTGATDVAVANDPRLASNREAPYFPLSDDNNTTVANDVDNLTEVKFPAPTNFDLDTGGVDTEAPSNVTLDPAEGPTTGGTEVRVTGDNLENVTSVTFGGVAGTALDVSNVQEGFLDVTTPAGTAGAKNVVLVDASGNTTLTAAFTYTA